jgi:hypothetical protein
MYLQQIGLSIFNADPGKKTVLEIFLAFPVPIVRTHLFWKMFVALASSVNESVLERFVICSGNEAIEFDLNGSFKNVK